MGLVTGDEFIVRNSEGVIYNFYLNESQQMEYIISDINNKWVEKKVVFQDPITSFALEIDEKDSIHIISICKTRRLRYHSFIENNWIHKIIMDYSADASKIYNPVIKIIEDIIHIFYYLHINKQNNKCHLVHLFHKEKDTGKDVWHINMLLETTYIKFVNPFYVLSMGKCFYIPFSSLVKGFTQLFVIPYDAQSIEGQKPIQITNSTIEKIYLYGLSTKDNFLHIVWSEFNETGLTVKYTKISQLETKIEEPSNIVSLSERSNCSFPILLYYNNVLWCTWTQMNKLYACYSKDLGEKWSLPLLRQESQNINFKLYGYRTNYIKDHQNIFCDYLYGTLYPKINFLGFGGEIS